MHVVMAILMSVMVGLGVVKRAVNGVLVEVHWLYVVLVVETVVKLVVGVVINVVFDVVMYLLVVVNVIILVFMRPTFEVHLERIAMEMVFIVVGFLCVVFVVEVLGL